ncbi:E2-like conjugating enzyme atg10 [Linnemannia hyalina]|uniref:Ubiquitin-like-conjugating enzyme ATG10 n=1 Tax=Linnemannia hyalina TaxID=64524 RepID=A0A9P7XRK8_9FUNG|nr:E2-like conjugating enzyme atg10 [Linnemannia hyalina]
MTSDTHQHQRSRLSARLSYSNFEVAINAFLHQTRHHTPWSYVEYSPRRGQPLQGYLTLTKLVHSHHASSGAPSTSTGTLSTGARIRTIDPADQLLLDELAEQLDDIPDGEQEEEADPVVENSTSTTTFDYLSVNYHIVFSPSYQVPVLYFNAYRPDGPAISLEEIYESLVPEEWRGAVRDAGLNGGISQQDHPVLNTPYFYMHPCETVPLMETILQNNGSPSGTPFLENYIVTWLSFTGQAIGVSVPTDMVATNG